MAKIIPFKSDYASHPRYQKRLKKIISKLDKLEALTIEFSINLATSGKWREWDESLENGDKFRFTEEMLKDTGDPNVDTVNELVDKVISTQMKLKNNLIE